MSSAKPAGFGGGGAATLYWKDAVSKSGGVDYDCGGIDPRYGIAFQHRIGGGS